MRLHIALVDHDPEMLGLITMMLSRDGHSCTTFTRGEDLLREIQQSNFEMLIMNWSMPDIPGIDLLTKLRQRVQASCRVLIVTDREHENDMLEALQKGADDFLTKPLRQGELLARVNGFAKRSTRQQKHTHRWGQYVFDRETRHVTHMSQSVDLAPREFDLAFYLFSQLGQRVPREALLVTVFGKSSEEVTRTLDSHVARVKRKLNLTNTGEFQIVSHYGFGYSLQPNHMLNMNVQQALVRTEPNL